MAKMTVYILPTKTRGCAPQSPETDENGGCPSDKTRVCQKQGFRHPDFRHFSRSGLRHFFRWSPGMDRKSRLAKSMSQGAIFVVTRRWGRRFRCCQEYVDSSAAITSVAAMSA